MRFSFGCLVAATITSSGGALICQKPMSSSSSSFGMAAAIEESASTSTRSGGSAEFPPPLSSMDKLQRAATFWSVALPIVANYYGLIGNLKLQEILGSPMSENDVEVSSFPEVVLRGTFCVHCSNVDTFLLHVL